MTMRSVFLCIFLNLIVLYHVTAKHDRLAKHRISKFKALHKILFRVKHHRDKPTGRTLKHGKRFIILIVFLLPCGYGRSIYSSFPFKSLTCNYVSLTLSDRIKKKYSEGVCRLTVLTLWLDAQATLGSAKILIQFYG